MRITSLPMLSKCYLPVFILGSFLLCSCINDKQAIDRQLEQQLKTADSLYFIGHVDNGMSMLKTVRSKISPHSPLIVNYYYIVSEHFRPDLKDVDRYADSALGFFKEKGRISRYPDAYYHALMAKGDASLRLLKYTTALDFFLRAKKGYTNNICDVGSLSSKIGIIYYAQNNYKLAARNWLDGYIKMSSCANNRSAAELFYIQQGSLNNIGLAYERAGMPDSAGYYYQQDLKLIAHTDSINIIDKPHTYSAMIVAYDNMGGLYLKLGKLSLAYNYLSKSINVPNDEIDGIRIPPLIKFADLNLQLGNYQKAREAFMHSRRLLDKYMVFNKDSEIKWNKLYAQYLANTGNKDSAYTYLNKYISERDTFEKNSADIYRLNIEHEIDNIQQQRALVDLQQKDKLKMIYLICAGLIGALSVMVMFLIYRNLTATRRNQQQTALQNQQLQQTLNELALVNKNYIRIMRVMAHDLRNPLAGMIGLATILLSEDEYNDESRHMLQLIESTGEHSIEMINELLKTGLADENELMSTREIDIQALLYDSIELLRFKAKEKKQQILFEGIDGLVLARINHEKMWRVFNNLIVNAIKFSHEGGNIKIGLQVLPQKKHVLISIADSGIGIPPEQKESVFEMFTPAKKTGTGGEQPFGLGLSISKRLVENHGGKIWFDSTVGIGTTFYIELPL